MAGFHPSHSSYTIGKLRHLVQNLLEGMYRDFRVPLEKSFAAFIVPDSQQLLSPDEIFVSFSNGPLDADGLVGGSKSHNLIAAYILP